METIVRLFAYQKPRPLSIYWRSHTITYSTGFVFFEQRIVVLEMPQILAAERTACSHKMFQGESYTLGILCLTSLCIVNQDMVEVTRVLTFHVFESAGTIGKIPVGLEG